MLYSVLWPPLVVPVHSLYSVVEHVIVFPAFARVHVRASIIQNRNGKAGGPCAALTGLKYIRTY